MSADSNTYTTGKIYTDYNEVIKHVESWIKSINPHIDGCVDLHVRKRIVQRIIELTNEEYCQQASNQEYTTFQWIASLSKLDANGLQFCKKTGRVKISFKQWIKHLFLFSAVWFHLLFFTVISLFRKAPKKSLASTILFESSAGYENCDSRFVKFCKQGVIKPLANASRIVIRTNTHPKTQTDSNFHYAQDPFIYLINNFMTRTARVNLLFKHLSTPYYYLKALRNSPINVLVGRDLAITSIVSMLDKQNLIESMILTTSSFSTQYLWANGLVGQKFKLHMIWYSQNFLPKIYKNKDDDERVDLPAARHMRVNIHWVWTKGFSVYLKSLGQQSDINVVGPLLWYLPESIGKLGHDDIKIAIFDITPIPDGETAFGAAMNYYSVDLMMQFIKDIVLISNRISAISGRKVLILLKHKRRPQLGRHDFRYIEFLQETEKENSHFKLIDNQTNLFGLLEDCDLSISVPYTSTAYVSATLETPGIYYDPFAELIPKYENNTFVYFAAGFKELGEIVSSCVGISLDL